MPGPGPTGGGGRTRVLADGALFEKAGVEFSDVHGTLRPEMARALPGEGDDFRATGVSLIFHPRSPRIPTVHANVRHIQRGDRGWFGGGTDLTPYYVVPEDAAHFHRTLRDCCARHDAGFYPRFKRWCDDYFFLPHRNEPRGVGGIFFDYLGAGAEATAGQAARGDRRRRARPTPRRCSRSCATSATPSSPPTCRSSSGGAATPGASASGAGSSLRRGRYVEFNLLYDRGTVFGLRTDGRVESILMSLPPEVRWEYGSRPSRAAPRRNRWPRSSRGATGPDSPSPNPLPHCRSAGRGIGSLVPRPLAGEAGVRASRPDYRRRRWRGGGWLGGRAARAAPP